MIEVNRARKNKVGVYEVFFEGEWRRLMACVKCGRVGIETPQGDVWSADGWLCSCSGIFNWFYYIHGAEEIIKQFLKKHYGEIPK